MTKKIIFILFICLTAVGGFSQTATNSWINYGQTYYKFTVGQDGLFHIDQSVLSQAGLGNVPVEQFQLWRNGQQQILYTSINSGILSRRNLTL